MRTLNSKKAAEQYLALRSLLKEAGIDTDMFVRGER